MLNIQQLNHIYPNGVQALKNIDLQIDKGMFGLLGPNGAGKSSLMRTLATLQQPTSGKVLFAGTDILANPDFLRRKLGYLPQDFGVYPRGTAEKLLDHIAVLKGIRSKKDRRKLVEHLLIETNLYQHKNKRLATFSGGMRQRFGIAQALIGEPELIIVDEPTAGLDPEERNRLHNLLVEISEKLVLILSTHIVSDVTNLCSKAAIMCQGQVIQQGGIEQLKKSLDGQIWEKRITKSELAEYQTKYLCLSTQLQQGQTTIRIHSTTDPGHQFRKAEVNLEDVYFSAIKTC